MKDYYFTTLFSLGEAWMLSMQNIINICYLFIVTGIPNFVNPMK